MAPPTPHPPRAEAFAARNSGVSYVAREPRPETPHPFLHRRATALDAVRGRCQDRAMSVIENSKADGRGRGSVGASVAYAALIRGSARHVALYDIAAEKVEAEVLDLAHGTQFTGSERHHRRRRRVGRRGIARRRHHRRREAEPRADAHRARRHQRSHHRRHDAEAARGRAERRVLIVTNPCDVLTVLAHERTGLRHPGSSPRAPSSTPRACAGRSRSARGSPPRACTRGSWASTATPSSAVVDGHDRVGAITEFTLPTVPVSTRGNWMPSPSTCATRPTR